MVSPRSQFLAGIVAFTNTLALYTDGLQHGQAFGNGGRHNRITLIALGSGRQSPRGQQGIQSLLNRQFTLQGSLVIDLLGELGHAEVRVVEQFQAHRAMQRQVPAHQLQARRVHAGEHRNASTAQGARLNTRFLVSLTDGALVPFHNVDTRPVGQRGVLFMVAVGGVTRLTESGLSITEWKPITGALPPLSEAQWQAEFEAYRPVAEATMLAGRIARPNVRSSPTTSARPYKKCAKGARTNC